MITYPKNAELVCKAAEYSNLLRCMAEKLCVADVYDELIRQYPQFGTGLPVITPLCIIMVGVD